MLGFNTPSVNSQRNGEGLEQRLFHHRLSVQAGAYQNATWVVAVAKAGDEDGHTLTGGTLIVDPNGFIVAELPGEADGVIVHPCDLDETRFGKETIFDFARHRRIEHYGRITAQTGVIGRSERAGGGGLVSRPRQARVLSSPRQRRSCPGEGRGASPLSRVG